MRRTAVCIVLVAGSIAMPGAVVRASGYSAHEATVRHIHLSDDQRTIHVAVGTRIVVRLAGDTGTGYATPTSNKPDVLHRRSYNAGWPEDTDAFARFNAKAPGRAKIVSWNDYRCLHATPPCEIPQREWWVRVLVAESE